MQNINMATLEGYLTSSPEFRQIRDGVEFAAFRMATNHDYRSDDGEIVRRAFFHNIVVKIAPTVHAIRKRLSKGSHVAVQGRIENRSYEHDGAKRYITEIVVNPYSGHIRFLDPRDGDDGTDTSDDAEGARDGAVSDPVNA